MSNAPMPSSPPKPAAASAATAAAVAPSAFDSLAARYNFLTEQSFGSTFADLIVDEGRRRGGACRVLDIGCGSGIGRNVALQWAIKEIASDFWGIEPDRDVTVAGGLFDHFEHALMETAELPAGQFDLAYSAMVMEHVADPAPFFQALHRVLKPGGAYVFVTPNARSFVPWATKTLHALKVDEIALRMLRGRQVEEYHYPVKFLCNSPAQLDRLARQHGFDAPQYAYSEGQGSHSYLRGPLAPLRPVLVAKRRLLRNPERLATMFCRMTRTA